MPVRPRRGRYLAARVALGAAAAQAVSVPPLDYDYWSAEAKVAWFRANLDVGRGGSAQPANFEHEMPKTCMNAEFLRPGGFSTRKDVVEPYEMRMFNVHPQGMVAFVKAVWEPNLPYTGMFQRADHGFVRVGFQWHSEDMHIRMGAHDMAREGAYRPAPMPPGGTPFNVDCKIYDCYGVLKPPVYDAAAMEAPDFPGAGSYMALKFFRSGKPSAAIHTGFTGDSTWNLFNTWYSNFIMNDGNDAPNSTAKGPAGMTEQGAIRGTRWPGFTGLHDMAMYDQDGNLQHGARFPYQVVFFPAEEVAHALPETCVGGYAEVVKIAAARFRPGTPIFNIYAKDSFEAPLVPIGRLHLDSTLMVSADSDRQVFFYHPRYDRDLVLRPELTKGYHCKDWWSCPACPYFPEFCSPSEKLLTVWGAIQRGELNLAESPFKKAASPLALVGRASQRATGCARTLDKASIEDERARLQRASAWKESLRTAAKERADGAAAPGGAEEGSGAGLSLARPRGSALLQRSRSLRTARGHRHLRLQDAGAAEAMLEDDGGDRHAPAQMPWPGPVPGQQPWPGVLSLDPISNLVHSDTWVCQMSPMEWPARPRPYPWSPDCPVRLQQWRSPAEPELIVDFATCSELPLCSKQDGMWYSATYPCKCGINTCFTGQLCSAVTSSCIPWGPYAQR